MKRLLLCLAVACVLAGAPTAAASPTIRLTIIHVMRGCHVWATSDSRPLGATRTLVVERGARLEIRINCPMSFDVTQRRGPRIAVGPTRWVTGTAHTLVFRNRGVVVLEARNVESSEEMGLQTMGADSLLTLTVRVR